MIQVDAPSRLHFGLLSLPASSTIMRRFGGVGLLIDQPGIRIRAQRSSTWQVSGPHAERALSIAQRLLSTMSPISESFRIEVLHAPPEHIGLGVGTQLGLAVGTAITHLLGQSMSVLELARRVGRGERSAIGVHGFQQGGFVLDAGKLADRELSPVLPTPPFPQPWRILVMMPSESGAWHGSREHAAFASLSQTGMATEWTARLCHCIVMGILPALVEHDIRTFGEAIYEYNRIAGEPFMAAQGDVYADPIITDLVQRVRSFGISGVGQSSWGPSVFAICESDEQATWLSERIGHHLPTPMWRIVMAEVSRGARITSTPSA